jgi:aspartyl-tRNA synthetase
MAMASQFGGVFEIGTIFRSENSNTSKHATEFEGLDVEFSNVKNINEIIKFESNLICYGLKKIINKYGSSIYKVFNINMQVPKLPFPIMTLKNVYQELEKRYEYKSPTSNYGDLPTDGEKLCKNLSIEKFNHEFIFVTDYSAENRPFYHLRKKNIPQGYDLI